MEGMGTDMPRSRANRPAALQAGVAGLVALTLALLQGSCAHAPLRAEEAVAEAHPTGAPAVVVTGSHIPQHVDPQGGLPATTSPVRIWSRQDLDRAGTGPNLAAALSKLDSGF